jgi:amino acid transporter
VILLTALNLRGLSEAGKLEVGLVAAKISILILFVIGGVIHIQKTSFVPFLPHGYGGVLKGMTMVFFAYMGFQVVSMMGGEIKESSKTVPRATLASIGIVAATISTLSAANANIIGASRVTLEMASEKQIPGRFTRLKNNQPVNSILLGSAITTLLIVSGNLDFIVNLTNAAMLSTMFLVNVSAYMLIKREEKMPPEKSYFKTPLGTLFPTLGVVSCILIFISLPATSITLGIIALLAGSILYILEDTPEGEMVIEEIRSLLRRPIKEK